MNEIKYKILKYNALNHALRVRFLRECKKRRYFTDS